MKIDRTFDPALADAILEKMTIKGLSKREVIRGFETRGWKLHSSMLDKWTGKHKCRWQAPSPRAWAILEEILGPGLPPTLAEKDEDDGEKAVSKFSFSSASKPPCSSVHKESSSKLLLEPELGDVVTVKATGVTGTVTSIFRRECFDRDLFVIDHGSRFTSNELASAL